MTTARVCAPWMRSEGKWVSDIHVMRVQETRQTRSPAPAERSECRVTPSSPTELRFAKTPTTTLLWQSVPSDFRASLTAPKHGPSRLRFGDASCVTAHAYVHMRDTGILSQCPCHVRTMTGLTDRALAGRKPLGLEPKR